MTDLEPPKVVGHEPSAQDTPVGDDSQREKHAGERKRSQRDSTGAKDWGLKWNLL